MGPLQLWRRLADQDLSSPGISNRLPARYLVLGPICDLFTEIGIWQKTSVGWPLKE